MKPTTAKKHNRKAQPGKCHDFGCVALLLQGGGALGAHQAGVYGALTEKDVCPDWVGGVSIGAINGAIIAGNKPEQRIEKLRGSWEHMTVQSLWNLLSAFDGAVEKSGSAARALWNQMHAGISFVGRVPGLFKPHIMPPWLYPDGTSDATSFYNTEDFKETLEHFIDFELLNRGSVHYSTSAVNIRSGNYVMFETPSVEITPAHIMASGALPPAPPAVEIEGEYYWDGSPISNTPLQWIMDNPKADTLVFLVDLWSARGDLPGNMADVITRQKEIQYSSRTHAVTDRFRHAQKLRHVFATLYNELHDELKKTREASLPKEAIIYYVYNIVHPIYKPEKHENFAKDNQFSRTRLEEHWKGGYNDTVHSLHHEVIFKCSDNPEGISAFDVSKT